MGKQYNFDETKERWVVIDKENEVELLIKPFEHTRTLTFNSQGISDPTEINTEIFVYCVQDWKGINDMNNKPLECNELNKKNVYLNDIDISIAFILEMHKLRETIIIDSVKQKKILKK